MDEQDVAKHRSLRRLILVAVIITIAFGLYGGFKDQMQTGWPRALAAGVMFACLGLALALIVRRK
jgi:hypothetical protein